MNGSPKKALIVLRRILGYGLLVTVVSMVAVAIFVLNQRPDLGLWHEVVLDGEFTADTEVRDFASYLALEERLFQELEEKIYQQTPEADPGTINRFQKGSLMDPTSLPRNWNRTFVLEQTQPRAGVLLLHGMSDSPYSLRHLGESCHAAGATVIGLRLPGHGTTPSGLIKTTWEDMAAAVRLAARHLRQSIGERPLYLVGYSNGAALAVIYAHDSLVNSSLPGPDGLVLLSPEIAVSPAAALAVWQGRMGHLLGLKKLAWNSISTEYDPFKYCSFAVNAAHQAHRITAEIDERLARDAGNGSLEGFPPVLAFQSAVDATVSTPALISRLFDRLPEKNNELVLFGLNRVDVIEHLLSGNPTEELTTLLAEPNPAFSLTALVNARENDGSLTRDVVIRRRAAGKDAITDEATEMAWPKDVFSLSHIALPFPQEDPLYGHGQSGDIPNLGNRALRGERGTLVISPGEMLRQRWNPFYPWLERESLAFMKLAPAPTRDNSGASTEGISD